MIDLVSDRQVYSNIEIRSVFETVWLSASIHLFVIILSNDPDRNEGIYKPLALSWYSGPVSSA